VFIFFSVTKQDIFIKFGTFVSMAMQFPEYGILSLAVGLFLISSGIDLSVIGIANLSSIIIAMIMKKGVGSENAWLSIIFSIIIGFAIGFLAGLLNGVAISKLKIPPILTTMGSMQVFSGIAIIVTEGKAISGLPDAYSSLFNYLIFGVIPFPLVVFVISAIIISILLSKSNYGRKLYMLGTNANASLFSGINNDHIIIKTYIYSGLLSVVAALIMMGRTNSAKADYGTSYMLLCVLICVLGGVKTEGWFGKVSVIVISTIILQVISSGLNMYQRINNFYKGLIWGVLLVGAMIVNTLVEVHANQRLRLRR